MISIIDKRATGKTSQLMLLAKEQDGIIVCNNPKPYEQKAIYGYGLTGITFIECRTTDKHAGKISFTFG